MTENKWFYDENLIYPLEAATKEEAIGQLGGALFKNGYVKDTFVDAVLSREQEYATGLPTGEVGVAIPHTDAHHVIKPAVAVGILARPVSFCEMGNMEDELVDVHVIFMLAVPDKDKVMEVLKQVMTMIQNQAFLKEITSISDRSRLVEILDKQINAGMNEKTEEVQAEQVEKVSQEISLKIQHPVGLHARPASIFVQAAKQFTSDIWVGCNGKEANAKSILRILTLGAGFGSEITLRAEGADSGEALKALKELVESNFGGVD